MSSIKKDPLRLALIGCGHIAKKHREAIECFQEDLKIVAACDANPESVKAFSQGTSIAPFFDFKELLSAKLADVMVLCSPSGVHAQQTIAAAKAGYHVVCEKPMAVRWKDALDMVEVCERENVRLFIVKQNRFHPMIQKLKQALQQNRFGKLYHVHCNLYWTRPQSYYDESAWRGTWAFDGGALMNQASHYVDLLLYLFGPVMEVQTMGGTLARSIEVEDTMMLHFRWRHGMLGAMNVTMLTYPKNFETSITVIGEKGTVKLGGVSMNECLAWEFSEEAPEDALLNASSEAVGHKKIYENILQVFQGLSSPLIDGREGLKSMELLIAAYRSMREGSKVSLPLEL